MLAEELQVPVSPLRVATPKKRTARRYVGAHPSRRSSTTESTACHPIASSFPVLSLLLQVHRPHYPRCRGTSTVPPSPPEQTYEPASGQRNEEDGRDGM